MLQQALAGGLEHATLMIGKARLDNLAPQTPDVCIRAFLIGLHRRRETDNVCRKNIR